MSEKVITAFLYQLTEIGRRMKVGVFGGTFNPIHYGHLRAAEEVREKLGLNKILFVPCGSPPLKTEGIAKTADRYEMVRLALDGNPFFELSDIECRLQGKSYTVKTIETFKKANLETEFHFILGIDAFLDIPNWWDPERLISITNFIIISRPDFSFMDLRGSPYIKISRTVLEQLDKKEAETYMMKLKSGTKALLLRLTGIGISSTEVRKLLKLGRSIKYLLPAEVQSYIIRKKLYRS
jgi:nicotinate-nucleotide adenylyltransferase